MTIAVQKLLSLFLYATINGCIVAYFNIITGKGHVLRGYYEALRDWASGGKAWRMYVAKPLGLCEVCMCSWLAGFDFWVFVFDGRGSILLFVPFIALSCIALALILKVLG